MTAKGLDRPISEKDMMTLVKAGATVYADQYVAGLERGVNGMLAAGFVFEASYLAKMSAAAIKRLGFK